MDQRSRRWNWHERPPEQLSVSAFCASPHVAGLLANGKSRLFAHIQLVTHLLARPGVCMGNWVEARAASAASAQPASLRFKANTTMRADYNPSVSSCLNLQLNPGCDLSTATRLTAKALSLGTLLDLKDVHSRCTRSPVLTLLHHQAVIYWHPILLLRESLELSCWQMHAMKAWARSMPAPIRSCCSSMVKRHSQLPAASAASMS